MADLDVEKKKNNDWWKWLVGILVLAIILWLVFDTGDDEVEDYDNENEIEEIDDTISSLHTRTDPSDDELTYQARF